MTEIYQFFGSTQAAVAFMLGTLIMMPMLSTEEDVVIVKKGSEIMYQHKSN